MQFYEIIVALDDPLLDFIEIQKDILNEWLLRMNINSVHLVKVAVKHERVVFMKGSSYNKETLQKITPLSFQQLFNDLHINDNTQLCILLSLYSHVDIKLIKSVFIQHLHDKNEIINEILYESNGYMIYHHQMENILQRVLGLTALESSEIRRNWNKKINAQVDKLRCMVFDEKRTVFELFEEKTLGEGKAPVFLKSYTTLF